VIRLSVTTLESFAYWKDKEDATNEDLLREIAHVTPPTRNMKAGRAWAKLWERSTPGEFDVAVEDGWRFVFDLDAEIYVPPIRELKIEEVFQTPSGPVTLVGKVDSFEGITVRDQKLTERFEIEERYTDSIQWRCYLAMLKARKFVYDVFVGKYDDTDDEVRIVDYHQVPFYSYPNIRADVEAAVCELAEIVAKYQPRIDELRAEADALKGSS
jgi:hypothetical protein